MSKNHSAATGKHYNAVLFGLDKWICLQWFTEPVTQPGCNSADSW